MWRCTENMLGASFLSNPATNNSRVHIFLGE